MMSADVKANIKQQESSIIYEGIGEVPTLFFFFYEEILHAKKALNANKQPLLRYLMHIKIIKSIKSNFYS